jgi:hypothetical protein
MRLAKAARAESVGQAHRVRKKKQKPSGGKYHVSVAETHTENSYTPVGETPTIGSVRFPPLLSISRGGGGGRDGSFYSSQGGGSPRSPTGRTRILDALRGHPGGLAVSEIMKAARTSRTATDVALHRMHCDRVVERIGRGVYREILA